MTLLSQAQARETTVGHGAPNINGAQANLQTACIASRLPQQILLAFAKNRRRLRLADNTACLASSVGETFLTY